MVRYGFRMFKYRIDYVHLIELSIRACVGRAHTCPNCKTPCFTGENGEVSLFYTAPRGLVLFPGKSTKNPWLNRCLIGK